MCPEIIGRSDSGQFLQDCFGLCWRLKKYFYAGQTVRPPKLMGKNSEIVMRRQTSANRSGRVKSRATLRPWLSRGTEGGTIVPEDLPYTCRKMKKAVNSSGQVAEAGIHYRANEDPLNGDENGDLRSESRKAGDAGPVAQRQSSGLIIHWS